MNVTGTIGDTPAGCPAGRKRRFVVRYLTGDDPGQAARVRAVIDAGQVFVGTTVLCGVYGLAGEEVAAALRAFSGLGVSVESPTL